MDDCIFCKIIKGEVPADKVYEDDEILAFYDIHPVAPVHVLVIPKKHIASLVEMKEEDEKLIGKIYSVINIVAKKEGISEKGFRVIINTRKRRRTSCWTYAFSFIRWHSSWT